MNRILFVTLLLPTSLLCTSPKVGFCAVPVADLYSQKLTPKKGQTLRQAATAVPVSEIQPIRTCIRATQLLFNERVTILEKYNGQLYIETEFWHLTSPSLKNLFPKKNNRFWTLEKNIQPFATNSTELLAAVPPTRSSGDHTSAIVVLKKPWYCPETQITYSAGTRFVTTEKKSKQYHITLYNPETQTACATTLPTSLGLIEKDRSQKEKRHIFIDTLTEWVHEYHESVPYVLGGASLVVPTTANSEYPYTGLDCSGLIRLACTVAGIPLFATNSKSIASVLPQLPLGTKPQPGDLLYWKGHIAVIKDNHHLIEARGYEHLYGVLHELPYAEECKGIYTINDALQAFRKKTPLSRIDKQGHHRQTITDFTILQLLD